MLINSVRHPTALSLGSTLRGYGLQHLAARSHVDRNNHESTPKHYGGAYVNYALNKKFNINVSAYWFGKQTFYVNENLVYNDGIHGVGHIDAKLILNATMSYAPIKQVRMFVSGRNLTNKSLWNSTVPMRLTCRCMVELISTSKQNLL